MARLSSIRELERLRGTLSSPANESGLCVSVCKGTGCVARESPVLIKAFEKAFEQSSLTEKVDLKVTGCHGFCEHGPLVVIHPKKIFYQRVTPDDVSEIVEKTLLKGEVVERLLFKDPETEKTILTEDEVPFYKKQTRVLLGNMGRIDPRHIEDYLAAGGYKALGMVLSGMSPEEVIETIKRSGLRGRGGAGFPTGRKWEDGRRQAGDVKYVIVNADEGDPGAFMDRSILEGDPYSVLEGLTIGAYAVGDVKEGYVYVRAEYPLAVKNLRRAIAQAEEYGFLGERILGSDFSFHVNVVEGAGAFVCGESSALMASLEGRVGEPRLKPPRSVEKGLWHKPTVLNNVKTWAFVPLIISRGPEWFSSMGTEKSRGTMVFSLVGKVKYTGLVEVPMGVTIKDLVFGIGGGMADGKAFKAVQTGGPSGGCLPASQLHLPVDYESLTDAGSMMGSGGMIVMDESTCMVDVARFFLEFTNDESCGRCVPCREGTKRILEILTGITEGRGKTGDTELLEELSNMIKHTSLCGLGQSAPNPVLSTLRYFRDEYEAHINEKRCPAGVCKALITYSIDEEECTGCGLCAKKCPEECISGVRKQSHLIDTAKCIKCGACREVCKFDAVVVQ